jgi:hypothetical protein
MPPMERRSERPRPVHFARRTSLLVLAVAAAGCGSTPVYLEAVSDDGRLAEAERRTLESEGVVEARIVLEAEGERGADLDGRTTDLARLRVVVENSGPSALQIPLGALVATDDRGMTWRRAGIFASSGVEGDVFVVPGGVSNSFEALFDLGAPGTWSGVGSVTFGWSYVFRGATAERRSRFLPVRYRTRYVERPARFGFGFGYFRRGYYDCP